MRKSLLILGLVAIFAPASAMAGFQEAQAMMKAGQFPEAARELQALIDTSGEWPDGHYLLGTCYLQMRKFDQAVSEFEKAIELNPARWRPRKPSQRPTWGPGSSTTRRGSSST
jgi:tetratricopeptide (TPR) repeat protein